MKLITKMAIATACLAALVSMAGAQTWSTFTNAFPGVNGAGAMMTLRDGRILVQDFGGTDWWVLTPDATGNYVNGTWSPAGDTGSFGYSPLYFGSQVLLDGHTVVVEGGEYSYFNPAWTNQGAVLTYSGGSFTWNPNAPPTGWSTIGDAQSVILADGRYMQANCCSNQSAFYAGPNTWNPSGLMLGPWNDEGAYTLLPNGKVLMVDAWSTACSPSFSTELFDPVSNTWSCGPNTPSQLWDNAGHELGPGILMYNGKVLYTGATNNTAVYNPKTNSWAAGPTPPDGLVGYDAPGALEPNGKVLLMLGPPGFVGTCQFMEYNPATNSLANANNGPVCPGNGTWYDYLMVLPSGQIMATTAGTPTSAVAYAYTPAPGMAAGAQPRILASLTHLAPGSTNVLFGQQLNGLSQNNAFGDDEQSDTDFPLVRLTCVSGGCPVGNVYWALTHDETTHSIAPGVIVATKFDVPASVPNGTYNLNAVANGIMSNTVVVSIP